MSSASTIQRLRDETRQLATSLAPACPTDDPAQLLRHAAELVRAAQAVQATLTAHFILTATPRNAAQVTAWLRNHNGLSRSGARLIANAANTMLHSPDMADAVSNGTASVDHAARLTPLVTEVRAGRAPKTVFNDLTPTLGETVEQFGRRAVQALLAALPDGGEDRAERQHNDSTVTTFTTDNGMIGITAILDPVRGNIVLNAIDRMVDVQWRTGSHATDRPKPEDLPHARANALVALAEHLLSGGASPGEDERHAPTARPLFIVHLQAGALYDDLAAHGIECTLDDGTPIPAATARRLACDADIIPIVMGGPSEPLDVGRRRRLATPAQRMAMRARSATCEFDNCDTSATFCKAHHLDWWERGGATDMANLAWACTRHHTELHQPGAGFARDHNGQLTVEASRQEQQQHEHASWRRAA